MEACNNADTEYRDLETEEDSARKGEDANAESDQETRSAEREELESEVAELKEELAEKRERIEDYQSKLQRLQADFENYKKRQRTEREEAIRRAKDEAILNFVPIYDNFARAFKSFHHNDDKESFLEGVEKIYAQFDEVLRKLSVEPIEAEGDQFDPSKHEALMRVESEEHGHNEVVEEFERGYCHEDRVLKPSKVKVNVIPNDNRSKEEDGDDH